MGKTDINISASEVTSIISGVMASIQTSTSTVISNNDKTFQANVDSQGCNNFKFISNQTYYTCDSNVYTDQQAVQSIYAQVVNSLQTSITDKESGFSFGNLDASTVATIQNTMATILTQSVIVDYTNTFMTNSSSLQICSGSRGGRNVIIGTSDQIYNTYYDQYSKMQSVQQAAADISNTLSASTSVKKVGLISMIMRAIVLICIVIIVVVVIGLVFFGVVLIA
jgi:hypothetical protein